MFKGKKENWIDKMLTGTVMKNGGYPICIYVFSFIHPPTNPKNTSKYIEFKKNDLEKNRTCASHTLVCLKLGYPKRIIIFALFGYP